MKPVSLLSLCVFGPVSGEGRSRLGGATDQRGVLLPVVLLLILGLGGISVSVLVLLSTQRLISRGELRYLEERTRAERVLADPVARGSIEGFTLTGVTLPGGFSLAEAAPTNRGHSYLAVYWVLHPDSIEASLPGALQSVGSPPGEGVWRLADCPSAESRPLIATVGGEPGLLEDAGPAWPRLGILGISELLALAESEVSDPPLLPGTRPAGVRRIPESSVIRGGQGMGVLVAAGDLTLAGSTLFRGLLIVEGDLHLSESSRIEGVVLAGGTVRIAAGAALFGCPELARIGLELPALNRAHLLPAGWWLGRY